MRAAHEAGHAVTALPGASAALAALAVAGLPTDRFFFEGFLPAKAGQRRARIAELARIPATLVLFETGPRLAAALADLADGLGPREAAVCRELTKLHEEVRRGDLATLAAHYAASGRAARRDRAGDRAAGGASTRTRADIDALLRHALGARLGQGGGGEIAAVTGRPRREVYQRALAAREGRRRRCLTASAPARPRARPLAPRRRSPERQVAFRTGISAESRAAALLIAKGFRILARRWRCPVGEIDIVARRRKLLVFVEVKARERLDDAAWSVTERQRARIVAAAEAWLAANPDACHSRTSASTPCWSRRADAAAHPGRVRRQRAEAFAGMRRSA